MDEIAPLSQVFDAVLAGLLLWLAWQALSSRNLFRGIVLFVAFGLLMALAWVRLDAPDVALAEAAIGAGLTGALLMAALARLREAGPRTDAETDRDESPELPHPEGDREMGRAGLLSMVSCLALAGLLGWVVLSLPVESPGLYLFVESRMEASGVHNPVTAVLLNFRGYDTLLEMLVLLLALLGVWSLDNPPDATRAEPSVVLDALARSLTPVLLVVAAYLLWVGADAPGGAFQAGAVLGASGVLLLLSGHPPPGRFTGRSLRLAMVAGIGAFLAVAALSLVSGRRMLEYSTDHAGAFILVIEAAATLSIGVTLVALFLGTAPLDRDRR